HLDQRSLSQPGLGELGLAERLGNRREDLVPGPVDRRVHPRGQLVARFLQSGANRLRSLGRRLGRVFPPVGGPIPYDVGPGLLASQHLVVPLAGYSSAFLLPYRVGPSPARRGRRRGDQPRPGEAWQDRPQTTTPRGSPWPRESLRP